MMNEKEQKNSHNFINALFDESDFVGLSLIPNKRGEGIPSEKTISRADLLDTLTPEFFDTIDKSGRFPCIAPNPIKQDTRRASKNVSALSVVFCDIDGRPLPPIAKEANFVFSRDGTHHHLYFLIERLPPSPDNLRDFTAVVKSLIKLTGADVSVHDAARVLRLPYSPHNKKGVSGPGYRLKSVVNRPRLPLASMRAMIEGKPIRRDIISPDIQTGPDTTGQEGRVEYVKNLFERKGIVTAGAGRSRVLWFIGLDCHAWGINEAAAIDLALALNDKLCDPPEDAEIVAHQIQSAYKYRKAPFGSYADDVATTPEGKARQKHFARFEEVKRVREILLNWVYVAGAERLINQDNGFELTTEKQQNNYITHIAATRLNLSELLREHAVKVLDKLEFRPDLPQTFDADGLSFYNRFKPLAPVPSSPAIDCKRAIKIFTDHVEYLATSPDEAKNLLHYLAYLCQNLGKKIDYAPLIISQTHGIGKSLLEMLVKNIFGKYVGAVENRVIARNFNSYMKDRLVVFVHELAAGDKFETMDNIKDLITRDTIDIDEKNARPYTTKNNVNFIFFSNRPDAIKIDKHDRRLFVIYNDKEAKDEKYYSALVKVFTENAHDIHHFLLSVDLANFNPHQRPAITEGKKLLISQGQGELEIFLNETKDAQIGGFETEIVSVRDVLNYVELYGPATIRHKAGSKAVAYYLLQAGFKSYDCHLTEDGKRVHRWVHFRGGKDDFKKALRARETSVKIQGVTG